MSGFARQCVGVAALVIMVPLAVMLLRKSLQEEADLNLRGAAPYQASHGVLPADGTRTWPDRMSMDELEKLEDSCFGSLDNAALTEQCQAVISELGLRVSGGLGQPELTVDEVLQERQAERGRWQIFISEYEKYSKDTSEQRVVSRKALEVFVEQMTGAGFNNTSEEAKSAFNAAISAGTSDPLVQSLHSLYVERPFGERYSLLWTCSKEMSNQGYVPEVVQFVAFHAIANHGNSAVPAQDGPRSLQPFADAMCDDLADCDGTLKDLRIHASRYSSQLSSLKVDPALMVYCQVLRDERISEVLKCLIGGEVHIGIGWDARTISPAAMVTEEGWQQFEYHLKRAKAQLKRAWILQPEMAAAPSRLITISMAGHEELSPRTWFLIAAQAEFTSLQAYRNYVNAIDPNWGGSKEEMFDFARECVQTRAYGTKVPLEAFRIMDVYASRFPTIEFWDIDGNRELVSDIADEYVQWLDAGSQTQLPHECLAEFQSRLLALLLRYQDDQRAGRLCRRMTGQIRDDLVRQVISEPELAMGRALARSGPDAAEMIEIDRRFFGDYVDPGTSAEEFDRVRSLLELREQGQIPDAEKFYLRTVLSLLPAYRDFSCLPEKACVLRFQKGKPALALRIRNGAAEVLSETGVRLTQNSDHAVTVSCRNVFRAPYRFRVTIEIPEETARSNPRIAGHPPFIQIELGSALKYQQHTFSLPRTAGRWEVNLEFPVGGPPTMTLNGAPVEIQMESNIAIPEQRRFDGAIWVGTIAGAVLKDIAFEQGTPSP